MSVISYEESQQAGYVICHNCEGHLVKYPFSCTGCNLDFKDNNTLNPNNKSLCPICGHNLDQIPQRESIPDQIVRIHEDNDMKKEKKEILQRSTWEQSNKDYYDQVQASPNDFEAQLKLAYSLHRIKAYDKAKEHYKAALTIDPSNIETERINTLLVDILVKQHKYPEALKLIENLKQLYPDNEHVQKWVDQIKLIH